MPNKSHPQQIMHAHAANENPEGSSSCAVYIVCVYSPKTISASAKKAYVIVQHFIQYIYLLATHGRLTKCSENQPGSWGDGYTKHCLEATKTQTLHS